MSFTAYPEIDDTLIQLRSEIQRVLGEKLLGLYLYGSAVSGDFVHGISDLDLLAVLASDLAENEAAALEQMHADFVRQNPVWEQRIEVQYFAAEGLWNFRTQRRMMGNISPGERFHIIDAGIEWLLNWAFVREKDVVLYGPSSRQFIPPITQDEYLDAVRDHARRWPDYVQGTRLSWHGQSYAILTMCRAYYSLAHGEQVSKNRAAAWFVSQYPEWENLVQNALFWRTHGQTENSSPEATYPETERFVRLMVNRMLGSTKTDE